MNCQNRGIGKKEWPELPRVPKIAESETACVDDALIEGE
jgi:hypothetical protein